MLNSVPLYGVFFSGTYFAFAPTLEQANKIAEGQYCPQTGLSAMVDEFQPGELELLDSVWWYRNCQIVHQDDVPWLKSSTPS